MSPALQGRFLSNVLPGKSDHWLFSGGGGVGERCATWQVESQFTHQGSNLYPYSEVQSLNRWTTREVPDSVSLG